MTHLLEYARGSLFNWLFVVGHLLLAGIIGEYTETIPVYWALALLVALMAELWAIHYKARAAQYRILETTGEATGIWYSVFFLGIRTAMFVVLFQIALNSLGMASISKTYVNVIILLLFLREGGIYLLLNATPKVERLKRANPLLETLADLILVFVMLFVFTFAGTLFAVPAIDLALPWYSVLFIGAVFILAYALFYVPFRPVYFYEELRLLQHPVSYLLSIVGMLYVFLSPLVYNSEKDTERFVRYLDNRPLSAQVSYEGEVRLKPKATAHLCEIEDLRILRLNTVFTGYFDPCIQAMTSLKHLDLSNNRLSDYGISRLVNLEYLDLSGNPLTTIDDAIFDLKNLRVLRLEHTRLPAELLAELEKRLPNTEVTY